MVRRLAHDEPGMNYYDHRENDARANKYGIKYQYRYIVGKGTQCRWECDWCLKKGTGKWSDWFTPKEAHDGPHLHLKFYHPEVKGIDFDKENPVFADTDTALKRKTGITYQNDVGTNRVRFTCDLCRDGKWTSYYRSEDVVHYGNLHLAYQHPECAHMKEPEETEENNVTTQVDTIDIESKRAEVLSSLANVYEVVKINGTTPANALELRKLLVEKMIAVASA